MPLSYILDNKEDIDYLRLNYKPNTKYIFKKTSKEKKVYCYVII